MKSQLALKGIHLKKTNEYLNALQQNLEQAGGLSALWSERTARMTTNEILALGERLGISEEGEYTPLASMARAADLIQEVSAKDQPKSIKDLSYKLTGEVLGFDQQLNGVWFDYCYKVIEEQGFDTVAPTAEELKTGFVNGDYDAVLTERYSQLRNPETNLLLSCHDLECQLASPFVDLGPMK